MKFQLSFWQITSNPSFDSSSPRMVDNIVNQIFIETSIFITAELIISMV